MNPLLALTERNPRIFTALIKATVMAVRYPGTQATDGGYTVQHEVRYDLLYHTPRLYVPSVPRLNLISNAQNGEEVVLHAQLEAPPTPSDYPTYYAMDLSEMAGDTVVVGFMNADATQPVILGSLSQLPVNGAPLPVASSQTTGERRFMKHQGTSVEFDKDGNVTVTLAPSKVCKVGSVSSAEQIVLGNVLKTALTELYNILVAPPYKTSAPGAPVAVDPTQLTALANWKSTYLDTAGTNILSQKFKTER